MRIRNHVNPFTIRHRFTELDLSDQIKQYHGQVSVEIGFGRGVFLRHWAKENPDTLILGIEVRKQLVSLLEQRVAAEELPNTALFHGSGEIFVEDAITDQSLDNIFVFHPDPWFKARHNKRRVINPDFVKVAAKKLKPSGKLHVSTDVKELWDAMTETLDESTLFSQESTHPFWENYYTSHWDHFSIKEGRTRHYATFTPIT